MARKGRRGGIAVRRKYGKAYFQALGRKGGNATKAKHGTDHLRRAGQAGHASQVEKYFDGDEQRFRTWFTDAGLAAQDPFPQNGAFPPGSRFPYGNHHPGHLSDEQWNDIWDDHFEGAGV